MGFVGDGRVCRVARSKKKRGVTVEHRIMKTYQRERGGERRSQTQSPLRKFAVFVANPRSINGHCPGRVYSYNTTSRRAAPQKRTKETEQGKNEIRSTGDTPETDLLW